MGSRYTKFSAYLASDTPEEVKKKQQQNAYAYVERAMDGVDGYELDSSYDEAKKKGILAVYDQYYNEHYADLGMPTTGKTYAQQNSDSGGSGASGGGFGSGGSGYSVYDPYEDSRYMEALNALKQAQSNLNQGGQGGGQADVEQGGTFQPLDEKHRRNPHKEGGDDPLHHDKDGFSEAVEVTYEAEKHGGEQAVDGVGLQIVVGIGNHLAVPGEEGG